MNENEQIEIEAETDTGAPALPGTEQVVPQGATSMRAAITERLGTVSEKMREAVIDHFVHIEADKQAKAMIAGLDKLNALERDYQKTARPDVVTYDADGQPASSSFSKGRIDERKKLSDLISKLVRALDKADDKADFGDLYNLAKG